MIARTVGRLLMLAVLAASGTYVIVYLYRWEWNRALIAGVFLISSQVALVASMVMNRLANLEKRIDQLAAEHRRAMRAGGPATTGATADEQVAERIKEAAPERRPFGWLDPSDSRMGVFVPVLMGAGALLSLLAWAVEKVASVGPTPALERGLARQMAALGLPGGNLATPGPMPLSVEPITRSPRVVAASVAGALAVTGILWVAIAEIGDLTQDRPSANPAGEITTVELSYDYRRGGRPEVTTEGLWALCRSVLPGHIQAVDLAAAGQGGRIVLHPGLGEHAVRRFKGCLSDSTIKGTTTHVVSLENSPLAGSPYESSPDGST